jgi:hypothetical protein
MRLILLTAFSTGCLISAPEGTPQTWPPKLGVTVEAVTSGDLDGNGSQDIVVYSSGSSTQAGMYLITAGKDLVDNHVNSFSKFVPADIEHPAAAFQTTDAAPSVYLATTTDKVVLTQYSNILTEKATTTTTVPAATSSLWIHPVTFPGNMVHLAVSNGSAIDHVASTFDDAKPIPAPSGPSWDMAQVATSYTSGQDSIVVVATNTTVMRATLPTAMGAMFTYQTVRSGAAWSGQTTFDLDGDGREEIIGFDLQSHQLCVVDPGAASLPVTPACLTVSTNFPGNEVQIFVGTLTPGAALDVMIAQASATDTGYTLVEDIAYSPGTLTAAMQHPGQTMGPAHGRTVMTGPPASLIVFGTDGTAACVHGPC